MESCSILGCNNRIARKIGGVTFYRQAFNAGGKVGRPMLSVDQAEAHRRVLRLYRGLYRFIPTLLKYMDIPKTERDCRLKLREYFYKNAGITDIRMTDLLVLKGYMELREWTHNWQAKYHVMDHWKPSVEPPPCGFIGKFIHSCD